MDELKSNTYITATKARQKFGDISRTAWWRLEQLNGFPKAQIMRGNFKVKLYDAAELDTWLESQLIPAPKTEPAHLRASRGGV